MPRFVSTTQPRQAPIVVPEYSRPVFGQFRRAVQHATDDTTVGIDGLDRINTSLRRVERYWSDQIRYIY